MTDQEILQKAIEKAVKNGWEKQEFDCDFASFHNCPEVIIFNHNFAKAFWKFDDEIKHIAQPGWQYHLQNMVLEENPISYLAKFL